MAQWVSLNNRIFCCGDSITSGYSAETGGWRTGLGAALTAAGVPHSWAGPSSDSAGSHRGVPSQRANQITSAFQTECQRYAPEIIIIGWGVNDAGTGATATQILDSLDAIINWAQAGAPNARIYVQTVLTIAAATAVISDVNAGLPARCAAQGVTLIDVGNPVRGDGTHPVDGATGYDLMASAIAAALIADLT